jgi:hypothetical protein
VKRARNADPVKLAQDLLRALGQQVPPANDDEPAVDEAEIRRLARADAEQMRRARTRGR